MKHWIGSAVPAAAAVVLALVSASGRAPQDPEGGGRRGAADVRNRVVLALVSAAPDFDARLFPEQVAVAGHYYEAERGGLRHLFLVVASREDLRRLDPLGLGVRELTTDARASEYAWVSPYPPKAGVKGGRVLATRSGGASALIAFPAGEAVATRPDAEAGPRRLGRIDLDRRVRLDRLGPPAQERARSQLRRQAPAAAADPTIKGLVNGVDPAWCHRFLLQLTGGDSIEVAGVMRTVRTRLATSDDMGLLTDWLVGELRAVGLEARIDTFFSSVHQKNLPQVEATIPGTDPQGALVLVTAHLDAVQGTPGADDNASGVTAVVAAARRLAGSRYRHTIRFVAFNAEEQGLVGSRAYAQRLASEGREVLGVVNLDMVAFDADRNKKLQLQSNGTPECEAICDQLVAARSAYGLSLNLARVADPEESSDYASFWEAGFPAVNLGDEYFLCGSDRCVQPDRGIPPPRGDFTPCYHRPCDRLDDANFREDLVVDAARLLVASVAHLAQIETATTPPPAP